MISPASGPAPDDPPSFLAMVGHELRNPLSSILAQAETLQDGLHGAVTDPQQAVLQTIQQEVRRTLALVTDMADLGRLEAGALVLAPRPCSLEAVQQQVLLQAQPAAQQRSVQISTLPAPAGVFVLADETRLRQILLELLTAALLTTPVRGEASLALSFTENGLLIRAGSGISAGHLHSLPAPQQEEGASSVILGRLMSLKPLGISLLRKLIQLHGGTLGVCGLSMGASHLSAWLPLPATAAAPAATETASLPPATPSAPPPPAPDRRQASAPIVLLADDQPTLVAVTTHYLEHLGFQVHAARDGLEAVEKANALRPHLILMDVRMPVLEGPQAIQIIRATADPALRATPIISLSGQPGTADEERCLAAGASFHLNKPFGVQELDAAIRRFVTPPR